MGQGPQQSPSASQRPQPHQPQPQPGLSVLWELSSSWQGSHEVSEEPGESLPSATRHHSLPTRGCTTENRFRRGLEKLHSPTMGTRANHSSLKGPALSWASSAPVMGDAPVTLSFTVLAGRNTFLAANLNPSCFILSPLHLIYLQWSQRAYYCLIFSYLSCISEFYHCTPYFPPSPSSLLYTKQMQFFQAFLRSCTCRPPVGLVAHH